ncbi:hypothetical protein OROHE_000158 [Orobanche hederae]
MFLVRPGELHHQYCIYLNSTCGGRAHDQLRAVLRMLLEYLPSDLPILLLATLPLSPPSAEDRSLFFDHLIAAAFSVQCKGIAKDSARSQNLSKLPKSPKVASEPKASDLRAKAESQGHALRRLRM